MLRIEPEHPFANYLLGSVRLRRGQLELAEDLFLRSMVKERNAPACAGLGAVMLRKGKLDDAETLLRHSLSLDPDRHFTLHTLAELLIKTGKLDDAEKIISRLTSSKPEDMGFRMTFIRLLIEQKKLHKAAIIVSDLLGNEDYLPRETLYELRPLAARLSQELSY
ncbi:MAG: tetratricopeptide repeat protein [Kiritimatiellae bacterium]|nr:tetratricopeptide repeat protein [Kiritimatiellia bacterium]